MRSRLGKVLAILWLSCGLVHATAAGLPQVIEVTKPSVVAVGLFDPAASPRFAFRGTGFAVGGGSEIVTNTHVLPTVPEGVPGARLAVAVPRGSGGLDVRGATLVRNDAEHDLALLRIDGRPLPPLPLADPASVREGQSIAIVGFPIAGALGFSLVTHRGIVSSITSIALPMPTAQQLNERTASRLRRGSFEIYQLDATAYPGNSGGPVVDAETGQVVGVINMVLVKGTRESALSNPTGISYAIPVRFVGELLSGRSEAPAGQTR